MGNFDSASAILFQWPACSNGWYLNSRTFWLYFILIKLIYLTNMYLDIELHNLLRIFTSMIWTTGKRQMTKHPPTGKEYIRRTRLAAMHGGRELSCYCVIYYEMMHYGVPKSNKLLLATLVTIENISQSWRTIPWLAFNLINVVVTSFAWTWENLLHGVYKCTWFMVIIESYPSCHIKVNSNYILYIYLY